MDCHCSSTHKGFDISPSSDRTLAHRGLMWLCPFDCAVIKLPFLATKASWVVLSWEPLTGWHQMAFCFPLWYWTQKRAIRLSYFFLSFREESDDAVTVGSCPPPHMPCTSLCPTLGKPTTHSWLSKTAVNSIRANGWSYESLPYGFTLSSNNELAIRIVL